MNDLLKFFSKRLSPFGYQIRPKAAPNFLRIANLEKEENFENVILPREKLSQTILPAPPVGDLNSLVIYVRTCVRDRRNIDPKPRIGGIGLEEATLKCVWSLIKSIGHCSAHIPDLKIKLILLDDHSTDAFLTKLKKLSAHASCETDVVTTPVTGQGNTLFYQFERGKAQDSIVYFCEDDYLHEENAIYTMVKFYQDYAALTGEHLVLYPQVHNALYSNHYPSYVVLGEDRHWRTIRHSTHTLFTHGKVVEKYWKYFINTKFVGVRKKRKLGSEEHTTNKLFRHIPGFSPLQPCAVHFQFESLLPPFYEWKQAWNRQSDIPDLN